MIRQRPPLPRGPFVNEPPEVILDGISIREQHSRHLIADAKARKISIEERKREEDAS